MNCKKNSHEEKEKKRKTTETPITNDLLRTYSLLKPTTLLTLNLPFSLPFFSQFSHYNHSLLSKILVIYCSYSPHPNPVQKNNEQRDKITVNNTRKRKGEMERERRNIIPTMGFSQFSTPSLIYNLMLGCCYLESALVNWW